mgnify:CR=1 FL=1
MLLSLIRLSNRFDICQKMRTTKSLHISILSCSAFFLSLVLLLENVFSRIILNNCVPLILLNDGLRQIVDVQLKYACKA